MAAKINFIDANVQPDTRLILFLLGPHWLKVPPLSLIFLENFLSANGFKTKIIDLNIISYNLLKLPGKEWLSLNPELENNIFSRIKKGHAGLIGELIRQISNSKAKVLGFSLYSRNHKATMDLIGEIIHATKSKTFVFGGPEILFEYHRKTFFEQINSDNSYFVLGEGELPLLNICEHIYNSKSLNTASYKNKRIIMYDEIADLNALPLLDFNGFDLKNYNSWALPLFSSRGCIKRCSFCSECKLYKTFRQHSPEYMAELIKSLVTKHGITTFSFHDSLINADWDWLDKFCSLLIKENQRIKWEAQLAIRKDTPEDLFKKMKDSGCYNLFVGLESASDKILKLMHKGYDADEAKEFFRKLSCAGLQFEVSLITGFPGENEEDFRKTLEFLKENKKYIPKIAQVNPFVEYPPSQINKQNSLLGETVKNRTDILLRMFAQERIKFTSSFINNLVPG
ncbi:MAG: radical SAM protein [Candidatus Omnitrophica bacterium]|nr:radical SAM protein [Candidatus Omnitrophota bacterium]MDD5351985.1 radical SAM protein [Candidatus Omnitrophota bacterium]MDD5551039.1 radical SAM protein [Candidatus Omnitrophota bacterium]